MIAARRNLMKPPRQRIRTRIIAGADTIGPKAPECAQLVIGLIQPYRKFERPFPSDVSFLDGTLRVEERGRKCGRKLHFSSRALHGSLSLNSYRALDAFFTFMHQRPLQQQRDDPERELHRGLGVS